MSDETAVGSWRCGLFERRAVGWVQCAAVPFVFAGDPDVEDAADEPVCGDDGSFAEGVRLRLSGERDDVASMGLDDWRDEVLSKLAARVGSGLLSVQVEQVGGFSGGTAAVLVAGRCDRLSECCGLTDLDDVDETAELAAWEAQGPGLGSVLAGREWFCGECGGANSDVVYAAAVSPVSEHYPTLSDEQEEILAGSLSDPFEDLHVSTVVVPHPAEMVECVAACIESERSNWRSAAARRVEQALAAGGEAREERVLRADEATGLLEGVLGDAEIEARVLKGDSAWAYWEDEIKTHGRRGEVVAVIDASDAPAPDDAGEWRFDVCFGYRGSRDGHRVLEEPLQGPAEFVVHRDGTIGCESRPARWSNDHWRAAAVDVESLPSAVDLCI